MNGITKRLFWITLAGSLLMTSVVQAKLEVENPLDRIVAVVNDEVITALELKAEMGLIKKQLSQQNTRLPSDAVLEKQLLDRMILRRIQLQMAKRASIRVDDDMLNRTLENIAAQNRMNLSQFRSALQNEGINFESFRENMRDEITVNRLQQRQVRSRIVVTQQEIDNFINNQKLRGGKDKEYHLGHILISVPEAASAQEIKSARAKAEKIVQDLRAGADFIQTAISLSDGQQALEGGDLGWRRADALPSLFADWVLQQDVNNVSEALRSPSGFHIIKMLDIRDNQPQHVVTQTHARHILIKPFDEADSDDARARLEKIRERIIAGEDFAALAKAHSDDPGSGAEGGELGWVNPGEMVPSFEQGMNALAVDELSEPVRSRFGWHVIQVLERRNQDVTEQVQNKNASDAIRERKLDPAMQAWVRRIRDEAFVQNRL
ncbi:Periplasmic chaperone and peptidyl-prolyl cis-trans isomerase of outer membrane proteins SurA [hydrothermal vent metagenome]|uniref:Periplasmic chaperone and peptidyl-prolyl cis-trans isomerase of outer membrane proteins SurA n=1 Tax=hydrothermal vent metagenome TaxID=652676 RepID=A0A3B1A405_9ZZZZ